jgi:hypothetical protein
MPGRAESICSCLPATAAACLPMVYAGGLYHDGRGRPVLAGANTGRGERLALPGPLQSQGLLLCRTTAFWLLGEAYMSIGTVDLGIITLIGAVPAMTRAQGCRCPMMPSLIGGGDARVTCRTS